MLGAWRRRSNARARLYAPRGIVSIGKVTVADRHRRQNGAVMSKTPGRWASRWSNRQRSRRYSERAPVNEAAAVLLSRFSEAVERQHGAGAKGSEGLIEK